MSSIPDIIQIKLENAEEYRPQIMELCFKQLKSPRERQLKRISVYLGEMAQALRSALNYAMWDFSESNLKPIISEEEYEKIKWSHDFPIEKDKDSFEKSKVRILRHIAGNFKDVYLFLESTQPCHDEHEYLWTLKMLSNDTAHTIPVEVSHLNSINSIWAIDPSGYGFRPMLVGSQVIIPRPGDSPPIVYSIPCFVKELNIFVSNKKRWTLFLINLGGKTRPSLIPFIEEANSKVKKLISGFYAFI